jgi:chemotaxis protein MotB
VADERPIIVKRIKKTGEGHHGGAWKVAYADFVTAMMAFFLLLWLLNAVTEEQKKGIAQYFRPTLAVQNTAATFTILTGQTQPIDEMSGGVAAPTDEDTEDEEPGEPEPVKGEGEEPGQPEPAKGEGEKPVDLNEAEATVAAHEHEQFEQIKSQIQNAIQESPDLKELEKNLQIDQTEDGIRIQLLDREKVSMFPSGSSVMNERSKELLEQVATVVKNLPNKIEISGHTDAKPYAGGDNYTNWELSADRANASRRVLVGAGVDVQRLQVVEGLADTDPFVAADPFDPQNRRISIVLLREKPAPATKEGHAMPDSVPVPAAHSGPPEELVP